MRWLRINAVGKEREEQEHQVQDRCQEWPCTSLPLERIQGDVHAAGKK
jgi:hypothetical protein